MEDAAIDLRVKRLLTFNGEGTLRAFCDLAVGDYFLIKGLRLVDGKNGLFVSMPRHQGKDGRWYDGVVPLTREVKAAVERVVLTAYQQEAKADGKR